MARKRARKRQKRRPAAQPRRRVQGAVLSISMLAMEFATSRETIRRVLDRGNVEPAGEHRTNPVYRLRDMLRAWLSDPASGFDPDKLPPAQRAQHYRAEGERLQHLERAGLLCSALEVEQRVARLLKAVGQALDGIPDVLERDCGASPAMVATVEQNLDRLRVDLHARVTSENSNGNGNAAASAAG